jgi:hypothetical protein
MKKNILCSLGIIAVVLAAILLVRGRVIGTVRGAEMEQIVIDGVTYVENPSLNFTVGDKDRFLGLATNSKVTFRVYSVKGDPERQYLYRLWEWEGAFYERKD